MGCCGHAGLFWPCSKSCYCIAQGIEASSLASLVICEDHECIIQMTAVGFEPTPFRNGALSHRLRPLGQSVSGCIILERNRKVGCSHHAQHTGILRVVRAQLCNRQGLPKFPCPLVLSLFRSVASASQRLCNDDGGRPNWSSGAACALEAEA